MSPDQRETLATVQMLRFPSPTALKDAPGTRSRRNRWSVYLSICLLMPALAAMIGIVAWAISIEVANENTANLIAASQQSKQNFQKQHQQLNQHKLTYLNLKRANQAAQDDQSSRTWPKQPVASAVVVGEASAASDEEADWQARLMAAKRATGGAARRRVLAEPTSAIAGIKKLDISHDTRHSATVLLTNIDQLSSSEQTRNAEYSTGIKPEVSPYQSDSSRQETDSPTQAVNGSDNPEFSPPAKGEPRREIIGDEVVVDITGSGSSNGWTAPKAVKKKANSQWLYHQQARKVNAGKLSAEVSLDAHGAHGVESSQLDENNKALMKKLESASGSKLAANKQLLIKQFDSTKVAPPLPELPEPVVVTTSTSTTTTTTPTPTATGSIDSVSSGEEEDAALHGKSDGLIDYSGGSVAASHSGQPVNEDELANNGASRSNNEDDEELGYAAIASAISTSLASGSSSEKPHTGSGLPHPHLEGDTGRESRVSSGWTPEESTTTRRRSTGENVAQVIDHIVERRKQSSNNLKGPQIVVVAPVGQALMRAQSLTLEPAESADSKQELPPVQIDKRISSSHSKMTAVDSSKKQLTNVRVKRNRPIGARLLGTGIEETSGLVNRRMDAAMATSNGMRFSERIQVIEDDDSSALIGGLNARGIPIQDRGETDEIVDMVESSKIPSSAAMEQSVAVASNQVPSFVAAEPRFSRQVRHEPLQPIKSQTAPADSRTTNKLYLAEQVVREHLLKAQQRADKSSMANSQMTPAHQSSSFKTASIDSLSKSPIQPPHATESAAPSRLQLVVDNGSFQHQPTLQSAVAAPEDLHHNKFLSANLVDQEFNVPAHMAESVIRQIERAPVKVFPFDGSNQWSQFVMQQSSISPQTPYIPQHQHQQSSMSTSASDPMLFWRHQHQPVERMHQQLMQPSTTDRQLARMQQVQPNSLMTNIAQWRQLGAKQMDSNEQRSISTRASGPQMALRNWLNSLKGHSSTMPVQQVAQSRMPEPSQLDAAQPETTIEMNRHAAKIAEQEHQQVMPQQEIQEVQDSYEQMSYQMPPSHGGGYDAPPPRPYYGNGDDNEKKSKGLTFHFGGGPIGGGSQLITSPMGIFKHLMIPLLPNPRVNLNGKVVFGVVLEKSTAFGEPKKKFKFWG